MRGATQDGVIYDSWNSEFQSTRPARGATVVGKNTIFFIEISIHAPREGRDAVPLAAASFSLFQSTRPARGATRRV